MEVGSKPEQGRPLPSRAIVLCWDLLSPNAAKPEGYMGQKQPGQISGGLNQLMALG